MGSLSNGTIDILGMDGSFFVGGCPVNYRMCSSISDLNPLDARNSFLPNCASQIYLLWANVPWERNLLPVENYCSTMYCLSGQRGSRNLKWIEYTLSSVIGASTEILSQLLINYYTEKLEAWKDNYSLAKSLFLAFFFFLIYNWHVTLC